MRKFPLAILAMIGLVCTPGCDGRPRFSFNVDRSTPGNHVYAGKFGLDLNEKTKVTATNVRSGRKGLFQTQFDADTLIIEQDPATWEGALSAMDKYAVQQDRYWRGVNDVMDRVPPIINSVAPIAGQWINAWANVALRKAMRPTLVQQLAGGITGGLITPDLIAGVFGALDPSLAKDAAAAAQVSTTQPVVDAGDDSLPRFLDRDDTRRSFALGEAARMGRPSTELIRYR